MRGMSVAPLHPSLALILSQLVDKNRERVGPAHAPYHEYRPGTQWNVSMEVDSTILGFACEMQTILMAVQNRLLILLCRPFTKEVMLEPQLRIEGGEDEPHEMP